MYRIVLLLVMNSLLFGSGCDNISTSQQDTNMAKVISDDDLARQANEEVNISLNDLSRHEGKTILGCWDSYQVIKVWGDFLHLDAELYSVISERSRSSFTTLNVGQISDWLEAERASKVTSRPWEDLRNYDGDKIQDFYDNYGVIKINDTFINLGGFYETVRELHPRKTDGAYPELNFLLILAKIYEWNVRQDLFRMIMQQMKRKPDSDVEKEKK